ncbi:MAG: hypothetical protein M1840_009027 [Geoglossum simile]|nr:MAG: hypothetical protein M1840_009027 [Geoglossum simile]
MSTVTIRQKESVRKVREELGAEDNIEWRELDAFVLRQFESHKFHESIDKISFDRRQSAWNAVLQNLKDNADLGKYHAKASEMNGLMNWWLGKHLKTRPKAEQTSGVGVRVSQGTGHATGETEIGRAAVEDGEEPKGDQTREAIGGEDETTADGKGTRSARNWWGTVL